MIHPPSLRPGDTIAIVSPAKAIEGHFIHAAKELFEQRGYKVLIGEYAFGSHNYFSGTDEERTADLQWAIDHPEVKAIICARGGYGCVRITERIQWANLLREPKWLVGFSDITVFQLKGLQLGIETIHATMPLNYGENSKEAIETLFQTLETGTVSHLWDAHPANKPGTANGKLIGGNLSIVNSLLATPLSPDFDGAVLFIEDIDEQYYHLDRMLQTMKLAGIFDRIAGLVVGGMTDMKDTATPTRWTAEQLVLDQLTYRKIPVAFNVPIGHIDDNRAVISGATAEFNVSANGVTLTQ